MIFTKKLDFLMRERRITRGKLARETGIPYTTVVGFYDKGYENIKLSNLKKLASYFSVPIEFLSDDAVEPYDIGIAAVAELINKYNALTKKGRALIAGVIDELSEIENPKKIKYIREFKSFASLGVVSPKAGREYELVLRELEVPQGADLAVRMSDGDMEPYRRNGCVYISRLNELENGDVGIFFVDRDVKCGKYYEDASGEITLMPLSPDAEGEDIHINSELGERVFCFGKVIV